jgi:hypothetical protein
MEFFLVKFCGRTREYGKENAGGEEQAACNRYPVHRWTCPLPASDNG